MSNYCPNYKSPGHTNDQGYMHAVN